MQKPLTPAQVLEEYDILGRSIPDHLIDEMRGKFSALEEQGISSWRILCDEVASVNTEKGVDQDRLYVTQAIAEILSSSINTKVRVDGLDWSKRIAILEKPNDFKHLFLLLNIPGNEWSNAGWYGRNGYGACYNAIKGDKRFGSWDAFKDFMGVEDESWSAKVNQCETPSDFLSLFKQAGVPGNEWHNSEWLRQNGLGGLTNAIVKRFGSWNGFKKFMKIEDNSLTARVGRCETAEQMGNLFAELGIPGNEWETSRWLRQNGYESLYKALLERFGSWNEFREFMNVEDDSLSGQVARCHTVDDFLQLFSRMGIKGDEWKSSSQMQKLGHMQLYVAIRDDPRFGSWKAFKEFMEIKDESWTARVADCETPDQFYVLFEELGFQNDERLKPNWLRVHGYQGLYQAIFKRFGNWEAFKLFMGVETEESWVVRVASCETPEQLLTLIRDAGISGDEWQSSSWLSSNGFSGLCSAIYKRFGTWEDFKLYMGLDVEASWVARVSDCKTASDFLLLFKDAGIPETKWQVGSWLNANGFSGLCHALRTRFGTWEDFLAFMGVEEMESDKDFEAISELSLEEAISFLGSDPYKLKLYLQNAHPELSEEEIDRIVIRSFKGLVMGSNITKEQEYLEYPEELQVIRVKKFPRSTEEPTIVLAGTAPQGDYIYVSGCWNRRVRVINGTFEVVVPLNQGEFNDIRLMAVDTTNKIRSVQRYFTVEHEGVAFDDIAALIAMLNDLSSDVLTSIQKNPGRYEFFKQCAEQVLIKKFSHSFEEGEEYVEILISHATSSTIRRVLRGVLAKFRKMQQTKLKNVEPGSLMFFQQYCAVEIRNRRDEGRPGVILGNDPGLGKTRTVAAAVADSEAGIFCPNAVVSAWDEEMNEVLTRPDVLVMRDIPHAIRKEMLRIRTQAHYVTNVQFLRNTGDVERFELLSGNEMVVVHDEAHSRVNEHSEQSKGARMLRHQFQINMTATPAKNPEAVRKMLRTLHPDDARFSSRSAFNVAFPANDPQSLRTLNLLLQRDMIRFRKSDVLEIVDPKLSLLQQKHRLPGKEFISPQQKGQFTMSEQQAMAIYKMFLSWHDWSEHYGKYIPDDDVAKLDRLRTAGALTKRHALRQSVNNPAYLGLRHEDAKAEQTRAIVEDCLSRKRKVVIFCAYNAQAMKYAEMFSEYNPALYTGVTSDEGDKKGANGATLKFARHKGVNGTKRGWIFDANGYPVEDDQGDPMSSLDYERLTFQNADDRQVIIATYQAGAVGTTFTAGKAMIFDDLPADVVEAIQSEDRIQRIDPDRLTHPTVEYYTLLSQYPKLFLEIMKKRWVVRDREHMCYKEFRSRASAMEFAKSVDERVETAFNAFFAQGTYDDVHHKNLTVQRTMFHLINDGIVDESMLESDTIRFKGFESENL